MATKSDTLDWLVHRPWMTTSLALDPWRRSVNQTIGGRAYNVSTFTGPTGQTALIYEMVTPVNNVTDLKLAPIAQDAVKRGKLAATGSLCKVQAGFEIHNNIPALESKGFSFKAN